MAKKMEHDKYAVYIIFLVAIVGVVAVGAIISDAQMGDLTGEAFKKLKRQGGADDKDLSSAGPADRTDSSGTSAGDSSGTSADGTDSSGASSAAGAQEAAMEVCEDSDGGIVFETQGTTSGSYGTVPGTSSYTDYCISGGVYAGQIVEYHCVGDYVQYHHYDCPAGEECSNGECVSVAAPDSVMFELYLGESFADKYTSLSSTELSQLADGTLIDNQNGTYTTEQTIEFPSTETNVFLVEQDDIDAPNAMFYLFLENSATYPSYVYSLGVSSNVNDMNDLVGSELEIIGRTWSIGSVNDDNNDIIIESQGDIIQLQDGSQIYFNGNFVEGTMVNMLASAPLFGGFEISVDAGDDDLYTNDWVLPFTGDLKYSFDSFTSNDVETIEFVTGSTDGVIRFTNSDGTEVELPLAADNDAIDYDAVEEDHEPIYYGDEAPTALSPHEDELMYLQGETCIGSGADVTNCQLAMFLVVDDNGRNAHVIQIPNIDTNDDEIDFRDLTYGSEDYGLVYTPGGLSILTLTDAGTIHLIIDEISGEITFVSIGSVDGMEIPTSNGATLRLRNVDIANQIFDGLYFTESNDGAPITSYLEDLEITATYDDLTDDSIEFETSVLSMGDGYGWLPTNDYEDNYINFVTWKSSWITYDLLEKQSVVIQHFEEANAGIFYLEGN